MMNAKYLVLPAALFALSIVAHGDGFGNTFGFRVAFSIDPGAFNRGGQQQQPRRMEHHTRPGVHTPAAPDKVTPLPILSAN
ncbi:MAG TPA: hypothetical protein VK775_09590 [Chthoniobacterales bacterium]|nr:hypothetical protein [Chthoniobacterales bacterium]